MSFFPLPYMPRCRGDEPDPTRPLRSEPVRREEVRVYRRLIGDGNPQRLVTMPRGTYRLEERGKCRSQYFVGDPALWQPLMDELAAQYAAQHEYWRQRGLAGPQQRLPSLEMSFLMGFEYSCEQCGARFLAYQLADNMVRLCSDKCERERTAAQQRAWREANARRDHFRQHHRTCEYCGVAIEAARATKRFCSDLCRIRAHNQRRREAADN
jgi:predicted nucleic acid-binding Zn ribbon protein